MTFKNQLKSDFENTFLNVDEFAEEVEYFDGTNSVTVKAQFFDAESDLGKSMMLKMVCRVEDLPNISKKGYFLVNTVKFGVLDFTPDEENIIMQILLQEGTS